MADLERSIGNEPGLRLLSLVGNSARFCFDLIGELNLECEGNQSGFWTPSHNLHTDKELLARAEQWQARGFNVRYASTEETADQLGTDEYRGALVFADGGTVNPLALCRGLAFATLKLGAAIHARSAVQSINQSGSKWQLKTQGGLLSAKQVIIAGNGGNAQLNPQLNRTTLPLNVIEYATRPLSAHEHNGILQGNISFTDKQPYIFTARFDQERRLIAAFPDFPVRMSVARLMGEAAKRIQLYFPTLADIEIEYLWSGQALINPDLLPRIYRLGEGLLAVQACNGRGLATNLLLGSEIADALKNNEYSRLSVTPQQPRPIRSYRVMKHLPDWLMFMAHLQDRSTRLFR